MAAEGLYGVTFISRIRENVRNAMRQKPFTFKNLDNVIEWIAGKFQILLQRCMMRSELLKNALFQKKITDFLAKQPNT